MKEVTIRHAFFEDADQMIKLGEAYYRESMFHDLIQYCPETMVRCIANAIETRNAVVAVDDGKIVGMVLMAVSYSIFKSGDLGVDVFYVAPEFRGTRCGNALQDAVMQIVDRHGYACAYEGSTSGFGHRTERQFTNMLKKRGFKETGPACVYINPNCAEAK